MDTKESTKPNALVAHSRDISASSPNHQHIFNPLHRDTMTTLEGEEAKGLVVVKSGFNP